MSYQSKVIETAVSKVADQLVRRGRCNSAKVELSQTDAQQRRSSEYRHGEDKRRIDTASNHFVVSGTQQRIIGAEMITDGLTIDDRPECAAEVVHMVTAIAFLDNEVIAR